MWQMHVQITQITPQLLKKKKKTLDLAGIHTPSLITSGSLSFDGYH